MFFKEAWKKSGRFLGIGNRRGSAFLTAMLFLVVLLGLGSSYVSMSIQEVSRASRARKETRALSLAESGLEYSAWRVYNETPASFPVTFSRTDLSEGYFSAEVDVYRDAGGSVVPNTLEVVSTGVSQGWDAEVKAVGRILLWPTPNNPVFNNALFSDSDMLISGNANVTGTIHSNGNLSVGGSSVITGDASAAGWIDEDGSHITGSKSAYAPKQSLPTVDLQYYEANASVVYGTSQVFSGTTTLDGITFVDGDVDISGQVEGVGVIVASGTIRVNGNTTLANGDSEFALISTKKVKVNGNTRIEGSIYAHNADMPGVVEGLGNAEVVGCVVADLITSTGSLTVTYTEPGVEMPGSSDAPAQMDIVSWRRIR